MFHSFVPAEQLHSAYILMDITKKQTFLELRGRVDLFFISLLSSGQDLRTIHINIFIQTGCIIFHTWCWNELLCYGCMSKHNIDCTILELCIFVVNICIMKCTNQHLFHLRSANLKFICKCKFCLTGTEWSCTENTEYLLFWSVVHFE